MKKLRGFLFFIFMVSLFPTQAQQYGRGSFPETEHMPPQAEFSWTNACLGDTTHFINETLRIKNYHWWVILDVLMDTLFQDTSMNTKFLFATPGTYYVYLEERNGHTSTITDTVVIDAVTKADFLFMHCSNHFVNHSRCASFFKWDFGDGSTSALQLPVHRYADTGHYNVTLIAWNTMHADTLKKQIFVDETHYPNAAFTYRQSYDTVFVHANDIDAYIYYAWVFGNGKFGTKRDTFTIYPDTGGTFIISAQAYDHCLIAFFKDTIYVKPNIPYNFSNSSLLIFPNPGISNSDIELVYNSIGANSATFNLFNTLGQTILKNDYIFTSGINQFKIPLNNISHGVYFVTLKGDQVNSKIKLLVGD